MPKERGNLVSHIPFVLVQSAGSLCFRGKKCPDKEVTAIRLKAFLTDV